MTGQPRRAGLRSGRRDWLWAVAAVTALAGVGVVAYTLLSGGSDDGAAIAVVSGVDCERGERLDYHVHTHLTLIVEGDELPVSGNIGIRPDCLFWLHTHSENGILHVEAPKERPFTLGQFFDVWGQPLGPDQLLDHVADATHEVQATINGEAWTGDLRDIPLADLTSVVLQYGPPFVPPPAYDWGQ